MRSTIVLVHGAFAESASWDRVIPELQQAGHPVVAAANPLREPGVGRRFGRATWSARSTGRSSWSPTRTAAP